MSHQSSKPAPRKGRAVAHGAQMPYFPGLDGLRAIAVVAVMLYHADLGWIPGGFLGVETFFVISGFLITALLLAEWRKTGRTDLKAFWLRRARRLLPAVAVLLAAVLAFAVLFLRDEVAGLRDDALASAAYATNWYLIFAQKSYFETVGRPSLLRHLWSLAVEEQFYLVWPLLFAAGMRLFKRRGFFVLALAGVAASAALMAGLYQPDADPSRVYYGTDTRAAGLLAGAALALLWVPEMPKRRSQKPAPAWWLDAAGIAAIAGLLVLYVQIDEFQEFLYRGGFLAVGAATLVAVVAAVHPGAHLGRTLLGNRLMRWIGQRSYSLYLWHWPIFMLTRPQLDTGLDGVPLLLLRLAAAALLAELSYRYVETPVRNGALGRSWDTWRSARGPRRRALGMRWSTALGAVALFSLSISVPVVSARPPAPPAYLVQAAADAALAGTLPQAQGPDLPDASAPPEATQVPQAAAPAAQGSLAPTPGTLQATPRRWPTAAPSPTEVWDDGLATPGPALLPSATPTPRARILAVGDSVMAGATLDLRKTLGGILVDAVVGRPVSQAIQVLREHYNSQDLGDVVVIHVGNNGTISAKQFDTIMQLLAGVRRVIFVTVKVPRRWEDPNNTVLKDGVPRYGNAVLLDWYAQTNTRPELFYTDGLHLRPDGARLYSDFIAAAVRAP